MLIPRPDRWTDRFTARPGRLVAPDRRTARRVKTAEALSWPTVHRPSTPERVTTRGVGLSRGRNPDQAAVESARSPGRWPDPGEAQGKHPTIDLRKSPYGPGGVTPPDDRDALLGLERAAPAPGGTPGATRTTRNGTPTQGRDSPAAGLPLPGMVGLGSAGDNPSLVGARSCRSPELGRLPALPAQRSGMQPRRGSRGPSGGTSDPLSKGPSASAAVLTVAQPPVGLPISHRGLQQPDQAS
jgi:hypothetical protein